MVRGISRGNSLDRGEGEGACEAALGPVSAGERRRFWPMEGTKGKAAPLLAGDTRAPLPSPANGPPPLPARPVKEQVSSKRRPIAEKTTRDILS